MKYFLNRVKYRFGLHLFTVKKNNFFYKIKLHKPSKKFRIRGVKI